MSPLVVLVGAPGAGKSTVGRRSAEQLGCAFVDSDALIEAVAGMSVSDIFVNQGEPAFRALEEQVIAQALNEQSGVVALGGGAVTSPRTRTLLLDAPVVWLQVSGSDAANRVGMNTARPLLLGNVRTKMTALLNEREPMYAEVATATIQTSGRKVREVVAEVVDVVKGWQEHD